MLQHFSIALHSERYDRWSHWVQINKALAPGRCGDNFKCIIFKHILVIDLGQFLRYHPEVNIKKNLIDDKSTLA